MIKKFIVYLAAILIIGTMSVEAVPFNYTDSQTASQVSEFTVPAPDGLYVGAIQISDIDDSKISRVTVTADTYKLDVSITTASYIFGYYQRSTITSTFNDYITHQNETVTYYDNFPAASNILQVPQYSEFVTNQGLKIQQDSIIWETSGLLSNMLDLINSGIIQSNLSNVSNFLRVEPSQHVTISVQGSDKVDVTYYSGTLDQARGSSVNVMTVESKESWFVWIVTKIPFIGKFIVETIDFLTAFFTTVFKGLGFFVLDFDIILLTYLTISMLHGIVLMSKGGTPFDGVKVLIVDFIAFIKFTVWFVVAVIGLIWRIVHAIAQVLKPI